MSGWSERLREWRKEDRWACLFAYALLLVWCLPLLVKPHAFGVPDWDWFHSYFYAVRTSILSYGELPGYNPWMGMGTPLWANPQIGPISYLTPWVLLFGPIIGLKLGLITCYFLSFEAGRSLGRHLFKHPYAAVIAGLLYALNAGLASQWTMGHFCFAAYPLLPWVLLWILRLDTHPWSGLWAGLLAGCMVQIGVHYFMIYGFLCCAIFFMAHGLRLRAWRAMLRFGGMGALGFLALALPKLMPLLHVIRDFPRTMNVPFSLNGSVLLKMFGSPGLGSHPSLKLPFGNVLITLSSNEFYAYIGFSVLLFVLLSLRRVRFYHVGAFLSFWLLLGNEQSWHLSYWLGKVPPFDSMWVFTRWRIVFLACLAFAAAQGVDHLLTSIPEGASVWRRRWPKLVIWLLPLELIVLLVPMWWTGLTARTYPTVTREQLKLPKTKHIVAVQEFRLAKDQDPLFYPIFVNNVGVTKAYEPLFGYKLLVGSHVYPGHPGYLGEYVISGGKAVTPTHWSPNRITFAKLKPGATLWLNITGGRGWFLNGKPLFRKKATFLPHVYFLVKVPPSGKVDLRYKVPGLSDGFLLSLMCLLVLLLWWNRKRQAAATAEGDVEEEAEEEAEGEAKGEAELQ